MTVKIYSNGELLPTKAEPQILIHAVLPDIGKWYFKMPFYMGLNKGETHWELAFVVLGLGFIFNNNWD